ncbi:MAG: hypothetical protein QXW97_00100 [Candidatus Pacearchaeota archaeon]
MSGVFGVYSIEELSVADEILIGTVALQHRGEEGCGISLKLKDKSEFFTRRANKLAYYFFKEDIGNKRFTGLDVLREMKPIAAISHTLYEDSGGLQPIEIGGENHVISLAMDGVLLGYMGKNDSVMRLKFSTHLDNTKNIFSAVERIMMDFRGRGSYCVAALVRDRHDNVALVGFRDPRGIKPLGLAKKKYKYMIMSENKAAEAVESDFFRDIEPGEAVVVSKKGIETKKLFDEEHSHCFFEYIYFADPTSVIEGKSVYEVRKELGRILARKYVEKIKDVDLVMASPDSGRGVALGFQQELFNLTGKYVPYEEVAIKNPGAKRTFQVEDESERRLAAMLKFFLNTHIINGKKVAIGDDSIVRGTVFRDGMIYKLRKAGAVEIYPIISCPPLVYSCIKDIKGTSFIAHGLDGDLDKIGNEVAKKIGATFVCYPSEQDMRKALSLEDICAGCVNGNFPVNEIFLNKDYTR